MRYSAQLSWRFLRVWQRNMIVFRYTWKVNFITPLMEPFLYMAAFGMGIGSMIDAITYAEMKYSYSEFIAPALIATAMMWQSFFETTYGSFVRMYYQKTFDAMLATPLSLQEIILAEIVWAATKAFAAGTIMIIVLGCMGFLTFPSALMLIPITFIGGLAFGSIGLLFTSIVPTIDMFNLPIFLFITPMFLFSSTFFPLSQLPESLQPIAYGMPLYYATELMRRFGLGVADVPVYWALLYLVTFFLVFSILSYMRMKKRLIR